MSWLRRTMAVLVLATTVTAARAATLDDEGDDDEEDVATGALTTEVDGPAASLGGWIDLRPSFSVADRGVHAENEAALTWSFGDDRTIGYTQEWVNGLYRRLDVGEQPFVPSGLGDGYLWFEFANVLEGARGRVRLSYEPRLYLPTSSIEQEAGLVAATRQKVKLDARINGWLELYAYDSPILAIYQRRGYEGADGPVANRFFENRLELGAKLTFLNETVTVDLKTVLQSRRFVAFDPEAANDDRWSHLFYVYPEVTVKVAAKTKIGAAFYSDSLVREDFGGFTTGTAFDRGVFQMVLNQEI